MAERVDSRPDVNAIGSDHSYEKFAQQQFYQALDRALIVHAPAAHRVVDFATGTGAMIDHLQELDKLIPPYSVIGIDTDFNALTIARSKIAGDKDGRVDFVQASVEAVPLPAECAELVVIGNALHLSDPEKSLSEAARVLRPEGTLLANSAYVKGQAYPEGTELFWGRILAAARKLVSVENPSLSLRKPLQLLQHTQKEYGAFFDNAGFNVTFEAYTAEMDMDALKAIANYSEFAQGALPGVPLEIACSALIRAVDQVFEKGNKATVSRNWVFMIGKKRPTADAQHSAGQSVAT